MAEAALHLKVMFVIKADKTSLLKQQTKTLTNQIVFMLIMDRQYPLHQYNGMTLIKCSCKESTFENILIPLFQHTLPFNYHFKGNRIVRKKNTAPGSAKKYKNNASNLLSICFMYPPLKIAFILNS